MASLRKYRLKRNFDKTSEPFGKKVVSKKKRVFVVQHHLARKDHYDLRLESDGILVSFAVIKGPSYNPKDKRLAIRVEDHPYNYRNFEGVIPKGEYGGGVVMLFDKGYYEVNGDLKEGLDKGLVKFRLHGERLKGLWSLVRFQDNQWLLIKDKDKFIYHNDVSYYNTSIKTGRTMKEIEDGIKKDYGIKISNAKKVIFPKTKTTKEQLVEYYKRVGIKMLPYLQNRIFSSVRCPLGVDKEKFFKKHFKDCSYLKKVVLNSEVNKRTDYYCINSVSGIINEVQNNGYEFHIWGSSVLHIKHPDMMVFDLDPSEKLDIDIVREGVKDLKKILDSLNLVSFLKTSGGKGYHVVVPISSLKSWDSFRDFAKKVALLMEASNPNRYTSVMSKKKRTNKIFIDWFRNGYGSTSVAPYSVRLRDKPTVSMPIFWRELDTIKPDDITIDVAIKRLRRKDPWQTFFFVDQ